jgi:hypothetical protein
MPQKSHPGRWTPGSDAPEIALLRKRQYAAVIVWRAMLRDALRKPDYKTACSIAAIGAETRLSENTIIRAQRQLLQAGCMTRVSGGGTSRKKAIFIMVMPKNYGKIVSQIQQTETGDWTL